MSDCTQTNCTLDPIISLPANDRPVNPIESSASAKGKRDRAASESSSN